MPIRVAIIGAGSIGFTQKLMRDVLSVPELQDTTFSFIDIDARAVVRARARRISRMEKTTIRSSL
jgi:alpha-galactosidase/6-phospho-beta-glucosidase family protein